ncbi:AhpD family alkylhydroperoxidase [Desulfoprunum benzoelyticum]|uniref:AhpD family alkylhydroperoxidase n=1 Tax=Desulfoprunum benzoelyticum TaxID=1506996 RepID=A0A840UN09_9BACT|nr:AhpD family alkylhydroperoxidase [Desulfoprunum benzoelyticum]
MHDNYPDYHRRLQQIYARLARNLRGPMTAFAQLSAAATTAGALDARTKQLIALGIGITVRCDGCIAYHVHDALRAGASREEILETIGVAVLMGGGPAVIYGCEALEALEQFEASHPTPPPSSSLV